MTEQIDRKPMFLYFNVQLQMRRWICGGTPKSPDTIEKWIQAALSDDSRIDTLIAEAKDAMGTEKLSEGDVEALKNAAWNGFRSDDDGLYIESRQVKAMFKESANVIKDVLGLSAFKARVAERVFVMGDRIHLDTDIPSGTYDSMVHAMTPRGPNSALKRTDYVERPLIECRLKVLNDGIKLAGGKGKMHPSEYLPAILEHACENGLGADRSQGHGQFDVVECAEDTPSRYV